MQWPGAVRKAPCVSATLKRVAEVQMLLCSAKFTSRARKFQTPCTDPKADINIRP